jgi:GNAT superfamily N-acetyltransferase
MPEIEIRPAIAADIPILISLDHHYQSKYTWQIDFKQDREDNQINIHFRKIRLPRSVQVEYPWPASALAENWTDRSVVLVAALRGQLVAFSSLALYNHGLSTWITDLVVHRPLRRQGIGSALIWASMEWALQAGSQSLVLEMQPKNDPAMHLAQKLGFEFFGYQDNHYPHQEIGFFLGKRLK